MIGAFCVGLAPLAVSPAFAQTPPEEIVVTGKYGKVPDSVQSLSQRVSYADLDLRNDKHSDILRQRVRLTEIGRETGRERVCHYVSISVVDVSLQKNRHNYYTHIPSNPYNI